MSTWNPGQYLRFGNDRLQPVIDLIGRIPLESPRVNSGCGTGSGTVILKERWPGALMTGVDASESMLALSLRRLVCVCGGDGGGSYVHYLTTPSVLRLAGRC